MNAETLVLAALIASALTMLVRSRHPLRLILGLETLAATVLLALIYAGLTTLYYLVALVDTIVLGVVAALLVYTMRKCGARSLDEVSRLRG